MIVIDTNGKMGRDLYGTMKCEHCGVEAKLSGGYDDRYWWNHVLPSFHCTSCGKNRAGEMDDRK